MSREKQIELQQDKEITAVSHQNLGYHDALGELLEWIEENV